MHRYGFATSAIDRAQLGKNDIVCGVFTEPLFTFHRSTKLKEPDLTRAKDFRSAMCLSLLIDGENSGACKGPASYVRIPRSV